MPKTNFKKFKLIIYSIIFLAAVAAVVIELSYSHFYRGYSWEKKTRVKAGERLQGEVNRIQKIILSIEQIPLNIGYVLEFANPRNEDLTTMLRAAVENNDEVFGACIAFEPKAFYIDSVYYAPYMYKRNRVLAAVSPTDTMEHYFSADWYLIPKILRQHVWIEPYYDGGGTGGNIVMSTYAVPFYSFDGKNEKLKGIIAVDISLDWLTQLVTSIKLTDESFCVLLSEVGTVISAPNPHWQYNESIFSLADESNLPMLREIGRRLQRGESGFVNVGKYDRKQDWWVYYMPIPANNWGILLIVPQE